MRKIALLLTACGLLTAAQRHRILFNRIGPAETGLFIADADGRKERRTIRDARRRIRGEAFD